MDPMARFSVVSSSGEDSPEEETARPPELARLLVRSAQGDEAAFGRLYDLVSARIYGLVRRVVRDPAQSEEVTQDVFLEIWRHSARFEATRGSALSWMLTIAHRKAVDRVRSSQASRLRDEGYGASNQEVGHDSTAEEVVERLDAERVRRALDTLTDAQRGALELAYFSGYTHTEVAALLELPLGTAKTRIRDGLIRLRDTLGVTS